MVARIDFDSLIDFKREYTLAILGSSFERGNSLK